MADPADPPLRTEANRPQPGGGEQPPALLAGFDAGQTHTTCRLAALSSGATVAEGQGPGVCHLAAAEGPERFRAALLESLAAARAAALAAASPAGDWPLRAAAVGASGIEAGTALQQRGLALAAGALGLPTARLAVTGDERTALAGAFGGAAGLVVICGTGTICVGSDGRGQQRRVAGYGWLLDGAGSAMDIGRDGLALSLRMADGRVAATALQGAIWRALGLQSGDAEAPQRIKALVVEPSFGAAGFAQLAPVVAELAAEGDPEAAAILDTNARALALMAAAVARQLDLPEPAICAMGGGLIHLPGLAERFRQAVGEQLPSARLVAPIGDACQGALQLAAALQG
ncbi:MAG: BadF/BadG/BcrA/BcrD ATPase family protein [Cyanobium sp.]